MEGGGGERKADERNYQTDHLKRPLNQLFLQHFGLFLFCEVVLLVWLLFNFKILIMLCTIMMVMMITWWCRSCTTQSQLIIDRSAAFSANQCSPFTIRWTQPCSRWWCRLWSWLFTVHCCTTVFVTMMRDGGDDVIDHHNHHVSRDHLCSMFLQSMFI